MEYFHNMVSVWIWKRIPWLPVLVWKSKHGEERLVGCERVKLSDRFMQQSTPCVTHSHQASWRQTRELLAISVGDINPLPSLMCLTSNSMLSHTHRNCEWSTTAGNRHRTELSCHAYTAELTHTHTHTLVHIGSLDPWDVGKRADIFHVCFLHQTSVLQDFSWILICDRWSNNLLDPTGLQLPLNDKDMQPRPRTCLKMNIYIQRNLFFLLKLSTKMFVSPSSPQSFILTEVNISQLYCMFTAFPCICFSLRVLVLFILARCHIFMAYWNI